MLFQTTFDGFEPADFSAYTEEKWRSKIYTRARMGVRDKLASIGRHAQEALEGRGTSLAVHTDDPGPTVFNGGSVDAQWLYFTRNDADARNLETVIDREHSLADALKDAAPYKRHLSFGLRVHADGIDLQLALHAHASVDLKNALTKLQDPVHRGAFAATLAHATSTHDLGLLHDDGVATPLDDHSVDAIVAQLERLKANEATWLRVGKRYDKRDPIIDTPSFKDTVTEAVDALTPVYTFLRWAEDNDFLALQTELASLKAEVAQARATVEVGDEVTVTSGLFANKTGVVEAVDAKGMFKVKVGKLVIQVKPSALKRV